MNRTVSDKKITAADIIIIAVVAAAAVLSLLLLPHGKQSATEAIIRTEDDTLTVSLAKNDSFGITSGNYSYTIGISDGNISVTEADCPDRTCVNSHPVGKKSGVICCVPGGLIISCAEQESEGDADFQIP